MGANLNNKFYTVDVFADNKFEGNQLAVFPSANNLSVEDMQKIAREINYSETTFITSSTPTKKGYPVRIFTPYHEVPFAGHPTLGTAYIIRKLFTNDQETILIDLAGGSIPVNFKRDDTLWMKQNSPTFYSKLEPNKIATLLSIGLDDIDTILPIQEVSTGLPFIIVPIKTLSALKNAKVNMKHLLNIVENLSAKAILAYTTETNISGYDLSVRVFCDYYGIPEDPATGSANGCLAAYLVKYKALGDDYIDIRVEQGIQINRPSTLFLKADMNNEEINVHVGGKVQLISKGELC